MLPLTLYHMMALGRVNYIFIGKNLDSFFSNFLPFLPPYRLVQSFSERNLMNPSLTYTVTLSLVRILDGEIVELL